MKFYCLTLLLLMMRLLDNIYLYAQPLTPTDSLLAVLDTNPHDTIKYNSYLSLHFEFLPQDTARSRHYLEEAITLSEKMQDARRICVGYLNLCNYLWRRSEFQSAEQWLAKVEPYLAPLDDHQIDATYFTEQGFILKNNGDYEAAARSFLNARFNYEEIHDTVGVIKSYNNIGTIYWELEQLDEALGYFKKGLAETSDETVTKGIIGNIGLIYRAKGDYPKALEYYKKSLNINKRLNYKQDEAIDLQNIGVLYAKTEDHRLALDYYEEAHVLSASIGDQIGMLYSNHAMAASYANLGYFQKAIDNIQAAFPIAARLGVKEEIKNLHESLSDIYEKKGDLQLALDERKNYEKWKDSLINENYLAKIKELEVQYETAKKNEKITILTQEKALQLARSRQQATANKTLMAGLLLVCTIAGFIFYTLRQRIKNQKILAAKNEEVKISHFHQQLTKLEMKALRAQMNPHFIFNCINSINRMMLTDEGDGASRYLTKFAKLIRMMLENSENPTVSLEDELIMLNAYLQLESLRFKEKLRYEISVDDRIDREMTHLPPMVLQPFIENAIWHGLMPKQGEGMIKIAIQEESGVLKCIIEDNGVGREKALNLAESKVLKKQSLGLQITEERLKLLNKEQLKDLIRITDLKDSTNRALGTRVDVLIPITQL